MAHQHICQKCKLAWLCNDESEDGSDEDCRWHVEVMCPDCYFEMIRKGMAIK